MRANVAQARGVTEDLGSQWFAHMRRGDLDAAWRVSDEVMRRRGGTSQAHLPRHEQAVWNGAPLDGQRVLIRCYHGLGDTIQFIRYAPLVRSVAKEVIVWVQPELMPILRTAPGIDRLEPLHDGVPDVEYDVDVEVMELPFVFRSTLDTLPAALPYLHAPRAPLTRDVPLMIGLASRAGDWGTPRSVPLDAQGALPLLCAHTVSPRAASCSRASSTRSSADWPSSHDANSASPSSNATSGW